MEVGVGPGYFGQPALHFSGTGHQINEKGLGMSRVLREEPDGSLTMHNSSFGLKKKFQGQGVGLATFSRQAETLASLGVDRIRTAAGRGPSMNGYAVWPLFGYDAPLNQWQKYALADMADKGKVPPALGQAKTVLDLYQTPEGRAWWGRHGDTTAVTFDLTPGSRSWQQLNAHRQRKGLPAIELNPAQVHATRQARRQGQAHHEWAGLAGKLGLDPAELRQAAEGRYADHMAYRAENPGVRFGSDDPRHILDEAYRGAASELQARAAFHGRHAAASQHARETTPERYALGDPPQPAAPQAPAPAAPAPQPARPLLGYEHVGKDQFSGIVGKDAALRHAIPHAASAIMSGAHRLSHTAYASVVASPHGHITLDNPHGGLAPLDAHNQSVASGNVLGRFHVHPDVRAFLSAIDQAHQDRFTDQERGSAALWHLAQMDKNRPVDQAPALIFSDFLDERGTDPHHHALAQHIRDKVANWRGYSLAHESPEEAQDALHTWENSPDFRHLHFRIRERPWEPGSSKTAYDVQAADHQGTPPTVAEILHHVAQHSPPGGGTPVARYAREDSPRRYVSAADTRALAQQLLRGIDPSDRGWYKSLFYKALKHTGSMAEALDLLKHVLADMPPGYFEAKAAARPDRHARLGELAERFLRGRA